MSHVAMGKNGSRNWLVTGISAAITANTINPALSIGDG